MKTCLLLRALSFLFLIGLPPVFSNNSSGTDEEPIFVSLGRNCAPAIACKRAGIRKAAYPFDSIVCRDNYENIINILDQDFTFFVDRRCFILRDNVPSYNACYNLRFVHEFPPEWTSKSDSEKIKHWKRFTTTFNRRIDRFRELRNYSGKVFFVRVSSIVIGNGANGEFNQNIKQTQDLKDALDRYFPDLNFTLVIVNYSGLHAPPMLHGEKVIGYTIEKSYEALQELVTAISQQWMQDQMNYFP